MKPIIKIFIFFIVHSELNKAIYIFSGIKTLNKFLYYSRYKEYYNQKKMNKCSLNNGPNCYFIENKFIQNYNIIANNDNINNEWIYFYNKTQNYEYNQTLQYFENYTKNYIEKKSKKIDKEQNSQGEVFKYLMTFDSFDEYTIKKDTYFDQKLLIKSFYDKEFIIEIKGKLKLSYDKDLSEYYLNVIDNEYPSTTYGIIESNYITISFKGKPFICNFFYIKSHNKNNKSEQIYFYGYIGNKIVFSYSYNDNIKRKEKWLKVFFPSSYLINILIISGPYDIDNISFTFPDKKYEDSNLYNNYNYKNKELLIKDEEI